MRQELSGIVRRRHVFDLSTSHVTSGGGRFWRRAAKRFARFGILQVLTLELLVAAVAAQGTNSPPQAPPSDPLGRATPQDAVLNFLDACHARQYGKAWHYLDLRQMSPADREKNGPELARQLEDLLDDTPFDIATLSRSPLGDLDDGLAPSREHLLTVQVDGRPLQLELDYVEVKPGLKVWLVSADSIPLIPKAHHLLDETPFEKKLPQVLVTHEVFDTSLWRWIVLLMSGVLVWIAARLLARAILVICRRVLKASSAGAEELLKPLCLCVAIASFSRGARIRAPVGDRAVVSRKSLGHGLFSRFGLGRRDHDRPGRRAVAFPPRPPHEGHDVFGASAGQAGPQAALVPDRHSGGIKRMGLQHNYDHGGSGSRRAGDCAGGSEDNREPVRRGVGHRRQASVGWRFLPLR